METWICEKCSQTYGACAEIRYLKLATPSELVAKNDAKLCLTYFYLIEYSMLVWPINA